MLPAWLHQLRNFLVKFSDQRSRLLSSPPSASGNETRRTNCVTILSLTLSNHLFSAVTFTDCGFTECSFFFPSSSSSPSRAPPPLLLLLLLPTFFSSSFQSLDSNGLLLMFSLRQAKPNRETEVKSRIEMNNG